MKNTWNAGLAIRIALFYFTAAGICQNVQAQSEVRFRQVRDCIIVVSVMADNKGPFDFVLDTGADTTIVDPSLASKLSLTPPPAGVQQTTLAGVRTLNRVSMATLAVGPAHVENLPVLVQDLAGLRKMDSHVEGVAGQDFLSHFNYLLDYRRHSIRFEQDAEIQGGVEGDRVPIEGGEHRMIVASEAQSVNRAKLHLLLDSGANSVVLLPSASQSLSLSVQKNEIEATSAGQVELHVGVVRALTVGSQQFHDITVALSASEPAERIGDGLLPTVLFHALYVNNHDGFVVLNPQPRKN